MPEYWVVDPDQRRVEVHTPGGSHLFADEVRSVVLDGFVLDVQALLSA